MTRDDMVGLGICAAILGAVSCLTLALTNCGAANDEAGAAYATENAACARFASSRAQAEACVATTQAQWCGDGGLQTGVEGGLCSGTITDGGHE